ncbi:hypothetical protein ACFL22_00810 [Patescibacteria group bacterium]
MPTESVMPANMPAKIPELIQRFEKDILYDCHSLSARINRSDAQKELVEIGQGALRQIAEYLKPKCTSDATELTVAWCTLLCYIEADIDPQKTGPELLDETQGWVDWAEKFAEQS